MQPQFYSPGSVVDVVVPRQLAPADKMIGKNEQSRKFYDFIGRTNLFTIYNILNIRNGYCEGSSAVDSILDYGCGFGRVTRWLRAAFPSSRISVTDIDPHGSAWCAENLGCEAIPLELPDNAYDLIWVGSVFTHLPKEAATALLQRLLRAVRPNGVLAITTHGRHASRRMDDYDWAKDERPGLHFKLGKTLFEQLVAGYKDNGYGYVDYPKQSGYGMCIADPCWYSRRALHSNNFVQILMQERADTHQDVLAFMRAPAVKTNWLSVYTANGAGET